MTDQHYKTPEILSDEPLRNDDQAHFHFDEFAITLARLAASKETRTPLTIGLSGAWGSGKTTLLRRIRVLLDQTQVLLKPGEPAILDFVNRPKTLLKLTAPARRSGSTPGSTPMRSSCWSPWCGSSSRKCSRMTSSARGPPPSWSPSPPGATSSTPSCPGSRSKWAKPRWK